MIKFTFTLLASSLVAATSAHAAAVASDNASNTAYNDGGFVGDNEGTGFGTWTATNSGGGGSYPASNVQHSNASQNIIGFQWFLICR